jgi:hypothetical protein
MRKVLGRYVEWAWSEGRASDRDSLRLLAERFLRILERRHGNITHARARQSALRELERDLDQSWRILTYGGRIPDQVPTLRRRELALDAARQGWALRY